VPAALLLSYSPTIVHPMFSSSLWFGLVEVWSILKSALFISWSTISLLNHLIFDLVTSFWVIQIIHWNILFVFFLPLFGFQCWQIYVCYISYPSLWIYCVRTFIKYSFDVLHFWSFCLLLIRVWSIYRWDSGCHLGDENKKQICRLHLWALQERWRQRRLGLSGSQPGLLSVCVGAKMPNADLSASCECGPWDSFSIRCSSGHCSSSHNSSRRHWRKAEYSSLPDACEVMLELQTQLQNKLAKTAAWAFDFEADP
jgi:hypothetical protein